MFSGEQLLIQWQGVLCKVVKAQNQGLDQRLSDMED
jgi:hypothetical protein